MKISNKEYIIAAAVILIVIGGIYWYEKKSGFTDILDSSTSYYRPSWKPYNCPDHPWVVNCACSHNPSSPLCHPSVPHAHALASSRFHKNTWMCPKCHKTSNSRQCWNCHNRQ